MSIDLDLMMETVRRREWLCTHVPPCPVCGEKNQIQLVEWIAGPPALWRCRTCKTRWDFEPPKD